MFTNEIVPSLVFVVLFIGAVFGLLMLLARLEQGILGDTCIHACSAAWSRASLLVRDPADAHQSGCEASSSSTALRPLESARLRRASSCPDLDHLRGVPVSEGAASPLR